MPERTVLEFATDMIKIHALPTYRCEVGAFSRWWHRNKPTVVHLSPALYHRLIREQSLSLDPSSELLAPIDFDGTGITNVPCPPMSCELGINVCSHYLIFYNPQYYGLAPERIPSERGA